MKKYVLAIDEGTTSARTIIFDKDGNKVSVAQKEFRQIYPHPGYVEHDAMEIFATQYATMTEAVLQSGISPSEIAAIGITNQRETTVCWNKNTGKPVYNAIVWQCRRTADLCEQLKREGLEETVRHTTGLPIDAYFSATKIKWILEHVEGAQELADKGDLLFGTIDTWLLWKLTGGKVHLTDYTNASRTMLFDIRRLCWDETLTKRFGIPLSMLPKVVSSSEIYAEIDLMGAKIPVAGMAGDQQSALYGQCCFTPGDVKNTYGTGCFLLMNSGTVCKTDNGGLITTIAATRNETPVQYAAEGSVFVGGAVIKWLRDELGLLREASDSEYFASKVSDDGVYVVPAFVGLGAPYWDMYARGTIVGLTRGSGRNHLIRAALLSIAYQTEDLLDEMRRQCALPIRSLRVDGGASQNGLLMQFQSDISNVNVVRPANSDATALGAAFLAGLAVGFWKNEDELLAIASTPDIFIPKMDAVTRTKLLHGWGRAIRCAQSWTEEEK